MKILFSVPGKTVRLADKERLIFDFYDGKYYDSTGKQVPAEDGFNPPPSYDYSDDPWESYWIEDEGLEEKLVSESIVDVVEEIDDIFGQFGFKNQAGEFVIEPQYAYAHEFTCGLAAVNLNRTWYRSKEGRRFYENHFGYINERGETVIPFAYDEAWPFNKYGLAVVEDRKGSYLIDTKGNIIPGTENLSFEHYYEYDDRFFEFYYSNDSYDEGPVGMYDTKERKILLEPSIDDFIEWSEDQILVYERGGEYGPGDFRQYYLNSKGEQLYPWLVGKGFSIAEKPNKSMVAIVAISKFTELTGNPSSYFAHNGKKYDRKFLYGIYSPKGHFILPTEYDQISEVADNIFGCQKNGVVTIIQVEDSDF